MNIRQLLVTTSNEELFVILEAAFQSLHGDAIRDTLDISDELAEEVMAKLDAFLNPQDETEEDEAPEAVEELIEEELDEEDED